LSVPSPGCSLRTYCRSAFFGSSQFHGHRGFRHAVAFLCIQLSQFDIVTYFLTFFHNDPDTTLVRPQDVLASLTSLVEVVGSRMTVSERNWDINAHTL